MRLELLLLAMACKSSEPEPPPAPVRKPDVDLTAVKTEHATQVLDFGTVSIDVPVGMTRRVLLENKVVWTLDGAPTISLESGTRATHTREVITPAQRVKNLVNAMEDRTLEATTKRELADGALVIFERADHSHLHGFGWRDKLFYKRNGLHRGANVARRKNNWYLL